MKYSFHFGLVLLSFPWTSASDHLRAVRRRGLAQDNQKFGGRLGNNGGLSVHVGTSDPTAESTSRPSASPRILPTTANPTASSTVASTPSPTFGPTEKTTPTPTKGPTKRRTLQPAATPTPSPTAAPTVTLTASPTPSPTSGSTPIPTIASTANRSSAPTFGPTASSSHDARTNDSNKRSTTPRGTSHPVDATVVEPASQPTVHPATPLPSTSEPSLNPSLAPTVSPSTFERQKVLETRVFWDRNNIMWDIPSNGNNDELTPMAVENWIVSIDGMDVGLTDKMTGYLRYPARLPYHDIVAGQRVCIRPPIMNISPSEESCDLAGVKCAEPASIVDQSNFAYYDELEPNPGYSGTIWRDFGSSSRWNVTTITYSIYIKDFCYNIRQADFMYVGLQLQEVRAKFSLTMEMPSSEPTPSPSLTSSAKPSVTPSVAPSIVPSPSPTRATTTRSRSSSPTNVPTLSPTIEPTIAPSSAPTLSPTSASLPATPSPAPSPTPSSAPSSRPTPELVFTVGYTMESSEPSSIPSSVPSDVPTTDSSFFESNEPTGIEKLWSVSIDAVDTGMKTTRMNRGNLVIPESNNASFNDFSLVCIVPPRDENGRTCNLMSTLCEISCVSASATMIVGTSPRTLVVPWELFN